jgi:type 2 lantibiotic biosynthesis protein LanM
MRLDGMTGHPHATTALRPGSPWSEQFSAAFRPLARRHLAGAGATCGDAVRADLTDQVSQRLVRLAARTLVSDLHRTAAARRLRGDTPQDRFTDYAHRLAGGRLADLLAEYPALDALLTRVAGNAATAAAEALHRLAVDRPAIVAALLDGRDPGPACGLTMAGDPHRGGRSVAVVSFADGRKVVYKPRPIDVHEHLNALTDRLTGANRLRPLPVFRCAGYGWVRHVAAQVCRSAGQLHRFYHRQGQLLAVLHLLNATDVHFENLVAAGEHPVLVDVETLFHPDLPLPAAGGPDPAAAFLGGSVFRSALLPLVLIGDEGASDVSGLGGDRGTPLPMHRPGWADAGTDRMRLVRRTAYAEGGLNRPDPTAEPRRYRADLVAGFRAAYDTILHTRAALAGTLAAFACDEIRVVTRPTWFYAAMLDESTHPDLLRAPADRERFLAAIEDVPVHPAARRLVPWELADLTAGDIPLFTATVSGRDVRTADGTVIRDLLPSSGATAVVAKLAGGSEADRQRQEWVIGAALATRAGHPPHRVAAAAPDRSPAAVPDACRLVAAASGIADEIVATAHRDNGRANWIGLEPVEDRHWVLLPMGAGLPYGYAGVALFLATVGLITGAARHRDLAAEAVAPLPAVLAAMEADPDAAAAAGAGFAGIGGICHVADRIGRLLAGTRMEAALETGIRLLATLLGRTDGVSYADGGAGALAALLSVSGPARDRARDLADRYAERLLAATAGGAADRLGPGFLFLHGRAGVAYALARYARTSGRPEPRAAAVRLLDGVLPTGHGWCGGFAGTAVALAASGRADDRTLDLLHRPGPDDLSLCHGELGSLEPLHLLADGKGLGDRARAARVRRAGLVLGALRDGRPRTAVPDNVPTAALLTGQAGIGHGLLRLADPVAVPSVLLMADTATT